jgi:hypothetical protein
MVSRTAVTRGMWVIKPERRIPVKARTEPTERSMPAVRIVNVIPMPRMIGIAEERTMLEMLEEEKKTG